MVKAAPKIPVKPKPKKQTKALVPLPVTVVPRNSLGSSWTEEDLVQNLVPEESRKGKRTKAENPKADEQRKLMKESMFNFVQILKNNMSRLQGVTNPTTIAKIQAKTAQARKDRDELENEIDELDAPIKFLVVDLDT